MIINTKGSEQKSSNNVMKKYAYKLDDSTEAVALIAETLRKSYKYIEQTPVQEYLSNARDIHRELKLNKAIDVQIPTELNPEFFIRDYGSGLSEEQIIDYITFAKSTKRKNNTLTGGFGYGSKSFFAYADSFTIISFYNGMKYIYRASCVQNKEGALVLLRATETKEPNGLQVQVAVRPQDRKAFLNAVLRLKQHWDDQEINIINLNPTELVYSKQLVDSVSDVKIYKEIDRNSNNYNRYNENRSVFLLIDGIPYPIDNLRFNNKNVINFLNSIQYEYQLAFEFKTGDIAISKYREYIEATPENISFIENHILTKIDVIKSHLAKELPVISNIDDLKNLDFSKLFVISQEVNLKSSNKNIELKVRPSSYYDKTTALSVVLNFNKEIEFPSTKTYLINSNDAMSNSATIFEDSYYSRIKAGELTLNQFKENKKFIDAIEFSCSKTTSHNIIINDCEKASTIEQSLRIKNYLKNHTTNKKVVVFSSENHSKEFTEFCNFFKSINLSSIEKLAIVRQKRDGISTPKESNINKQNYTNTFVELTNQGEFKIRRKSEKVSFNHNSKFPNKTLVAPTQSNAFAKDVSESVLVWAKFCGYEVVLANKENCELLCKKANTVSYNDFIANPKYSKVEERNIINFHQILLMLDFKQKNSLVYYIGDFVDYLPEAFNKKDLTIIKTARNMINRDKYNESAITGLEEGLVEFKNLKVNAYKNKAKEQFKQIINTFDKYSFVSVLDCGGSYDIKEKKELYLKVFKKMSV